MFDVFNISTKWQCGYIALAVFVGRIRLLKTLVSWLTFSSDVPPAGLAVSLIRGDTVMLAGSEISTHSLAEYI